MATTKNQIRANRLNSQNSRGPTSPEGKAASAQNAIKHGLLSGKPSALPWEDAHELAHFRAQMQAELKPQGPLENALVEQIGSALWKLRRMDHFEYGILEYYYLDILEKRETDSAASLVRTENAFLDAIPGKVTRVVDRVRYDHYQEQARQIRELRDEVRPSIGEAFIADVQGPDALGKLRRYQTATENSLYRALHELQRLQAARQGSTVRAPAALDVGLSISTPDASDHSAE
jgi:hypothetical protein